MLFSFGKIWHLYLEKFCCFFFFFFVFFCFFCFFLSLHAYLFPWIFIVKSHDTQCMIMHHLKFWMHNISAVIDKFCTCYSVTMIINFKGNQYTFKGDNYLKIVLAPFWKGPTLKGKNLLPRGANSFQDLFSKELDVQESKQEVTKVVSLV